jgi:hypothetical protein
MISVMLQVLSLPVHMQTRREFVANFRCLSGYKDVYNMAKNAFGRYVHLKLKYVFPQYLTCGAVQEDLK